MFNNGYPFAIQTAVITGAGIIGPPIGYSLTTNAVWISQELVWALALNN